MSEPGLPRPQTLDDADWSDLQEAPLGETVRTPKSGEPEFEPWHPAAEPVSAPEPTPGAESEFEVGLGLEPPPQTGTASPRRGRDYRNAGDVAGRDIHTTVTQTAMRNIFYNLPLAETESRATRRRAAVLDTTALDRRAAMTVAPPGLLGRLKDLKHGRMFVLACPTREDLAGRCGQNSAALLLLSKLLDDPTVELADKSVHRLVLDRDDKEKSDQLLSILEAEAAGTAFTIDLVDADPAQVDDVLADTGNISRLLHDARAFLVIAVPKSHLDGFARELPGRVYSMARPDGARVFRAHLGEAFTGGEADTLVADPTLSAKLSKAWPAEAAELARWARESKAFGSDTAEVVRGLRDAQQDWSGALNRTLDVDVNAYRRCLLLSAAVLEGADPNTVIDAATLLMKTANYSMEPVHPLERPSAISQLGDFGDDVVFKPGEVKFGGPGFSEAVLPFVWRGYGPLRAALRSWLVRLPVRVRSLTTADLNRLADRVTQLARRHGAEIATSIAGSWAATPKPEQQQAGRGRRPAPDSIARTRRSMAVRVLAECASDQVIGAKVRNQLWQWAYHSKDPGVQLAVAEVCGTGFGVGFPRNALLRLRHVSRSDVEVVRAEAVKAVCRIGNGIGLRELNQYLREWLVNGSSHQHEVLTRAYGRVLDDVDATKLGRAHSNTNLITGSVTAMWTAMYQAVSPLQLRETVAAWLRLATRAERRYGDAMVGLLVTAVGDSVRNTGVLLHTLRGRGSVDGQPNREDQLLEVIHTRLDELEAVR